jgi:hypothetical protein
MNDWRFVGAGTGEGRHQALDLGIVTVHILYRRWRPVGYWWEVRFEMLNRRHDDSYGNFKNPEACKGAALGWVYDRLVGSLRMILMRMPLEDRKGCIEHTCGLLHATERE